MELKKFMGYKLKFITFLFTMFFLYCTSNNLNFDETISINIENCNLSYNEQIKESRFSENEIYVVGHAYGKPGEGEFFPDNLTNFFADNLNMQSINYLALTGDFVRNPDLNSYTKVKDYIDENFDGYFISIGNHEIDNGHNISGPGLDNYFKIFNKDFFYQEFNHFLIISANFSNQDWLPNVEQKKEINDLINTTDKDYVIILTHQLFWLLDAEEDISPNSDALLRENLNQNSLNWIDKVNNKNFIVISGDYGAFGDETYCTHKDNKLFIANGIGNLNSDTILKISENDLNFNITERKLNDF
tara:strand:- start:122 stop:1027 length:906 start_codon:yes stop_codon:yes gene_type:complete